MRHWYVTQHKASLDARGNRRAALRARGRGFAYNRRIISALEPLISVYFLSRTVLALELS